MNQHPHGHPTGGIEKGLETMQQMIGAVVVNYYNVYQFHSFVPKLCLNRGFDIDSALAYAKYSR